MEIQGLQKLTLLDWPGRTACTVFLAGCELRCPFCHNFSLVEGPFPPGLPEEELLAFLSTRRGLLDGVCITGGEPLLRPELPALLEKIHALGFPVKLDTNGFHPDRLAALWERGLVDYVAMDVKNSLDRYPETTGVPGLDTAPVRESVRWLLQGKADYEFRTTVVKPLHDEGSFRELGPWLQGAKRYFLQSFVCREAVPDQSLTPCTGEEMARFADLVRPFVPPVALRGV